MEARVEKDNASSGREAGTAKEVPKAVEKRAHMQPGMMTMEKQAHGVVAARKLRPTMSTSKMSPMQKPVAQKLRGR